jgi:hypothetical protein
MRERISPREVGFEEVARQDNVCLTLSLLNVNAVLSDWINNNTHQTNLMGEDCGVS